MIVPLQFLLTYVVPFTIILGVIITVHELGHFWAARMFGVAVDRFSIGFGKPLWSRTDKTGVEWRIAWIPLGGYVRFAGDSNDASLPDGEELEGLRQQIIAKEGPGAERRYYHFKPVWQRAIIAVAGPAANFALAIVLFWVFLLTIGQHRDQLPKVAMVEPGSPAAVAGFMPGDMVLTAGGHRIRMASELVDYVSMRAGEVITFRVDRGGEVVELKAVPKSKVTHIDVINVESKVGRIGLGLTQDPKDTVLIEYNPANALGEAARLTVDRVGVTLTYLRRIFTGHENGDQLSGVIGMGYVSGKVVSSAPATLTLGQQITGVLLNLVSLAATVSVGIGFVNLLPIPMLDGGHLLFYGYEAVARRPLAANIQAASYRVGLALVLGLMLFATWNDLQRLRAFQFLGGLFS
jgi:regulator of sigma E protease